MQVSQVAYDRFLVWLPATEPDRQPLADPDVAAEAASWLWDLGPAPVIAVVGLGSGRPEWLSEWSAVSVAGDPCSTASACAVLLATREELERFLSHGAPHELTRLLWPRLGPGRTLGALTSGGPSWADTVEAHAMVERDGNLLEVVLSPN